MAQENELVPVLRMTMRLLDEKRDEQDPAAARDRRMRLSLGESLERLRQAEDAEQKSGILWGPAEKAYSQALHIACSALDFLEARDAGRGLEVIPKPLNAPNAEPPRCGYCLQVTWTRAERPMCAECWAHFERYFAGADPGPDRSHNDPQLPTLAELFPLEVSDGR